VTWQGVRVHTDICARCGTDRASQRRDPTDCIAWNVLYLRHVWGWVDPEHGQPDHTCGACNPEHVRVP